MHIASVPKDPIWHPYSHKNIYQFDSSLPVRFSLKRKLDARFSLGEPNHVLVAFKRFYDSKGWSKTNFTKLQNIGSN